MHINVVTIEQATSGGLFSLIEEKCCSVVSIPFIAIAMVNSEPKFRVCDPNLINPFSSGWQHIEDVGSTSLLLKLRALRVCKKTATVAELRPGAYFGEGVQEIEIALPLYQTW